jgi:hypothetical protein
MRKVKCVGLPPCRRYQPLSALRSCLWLTASVREANVALSQSDGYNPSMEEVEVQWIAPLVSYGQCFHRTLSDHHSAALCVETR